MNPSALRGGQHTVHCVWGVCGGGGGVRRGCGGSRFHVWGGGGLGRGRAGARRQMIFFGHPDQPEMIGHPHTLPTPYCMFLPALFETKQQLKGTGRMSAMLCSPVSLQVVQ